MLFADPDELGVEVLPVIDEAGSRMFAVGLAEVLEGGILGIGVAPAVTGEDAAGVGVDDEPRMAAGVEEHGIGGFGSDTGDGEQAVADFVGGALEEGVEAGVEGLDEDFDERAQASGFDAVATRGADPVGDGLFGSVVDGEGMEGVGVAEAGDGLLDVFPAGVLDEDGADADLEG